MNAVQPPSEWIGRDEGSPGYWTGTASMPRSAQHENVAIHLYSPGYADGGLLGFFDYEQTTHAYFPQDHFDEVVQAGGWTFGRKGKGYVALWSWAPTAWQDYPAEELARPTTCSRRCRTGARVRTRARRTPGRPPSTRTRSSSPRTR